MYIYMALHIIGAYMIFSIYIYTKKSPVPVMPGSNCPVASTRTSTGFAAERYATKQHERYHRDDAWRDMGA